MGSVNDYNLTSNDLRSMDQAKKAGTKSALNSFVMGRISDSQMDRRLTEQELANMGDLVKQLGKRPGEPVYQKEVF